MTYSVRRTTDRRGFIRQIAGGLAAATCASTILMSAKAARKRPNVLFLAVDDWNDWTGPNGNKQVKTPNLDKLARRGVTFTNAHCPGVYCAPSRTAIMTGVHPHTSGSYADQTHMFNHAEYKAIQTWFKENRYGVYGTGKLYHHMPGYLDLNGWDEFFVRTEEQKSDGWPMGSWDYGAPIPKDWPGSPLYKGQELKKPPSFLEYGVLDNEVEEEMADTIRANWAARVLERKHDKPFFLGFGLYAPHRANYVPKKYFDMYPIETVELPPWKEDDLDDLPKLIQNQRRNRKIRVHDPLVKLGATKTSLQGYLAAVSYADAMLGRVLDALEKNGHADNTVVVLWSDNGYHHGEKYHWGKHTLWQRTTNVPFMWAGPGIARGAKVDTTVGLIDTYATLIDLCDLPENPHVEGVSLASSLRKPESARDRTVVIAGADGPSFAAVNKQWRFIRYENGDEELYDLRKDWNEWSNLASQGDFAEVKQTMAKALPKNPAKPGLGLKSRQTRLVREGQSFHWERVKKPNPAKQQGSMKKGK